MSKRLALGAELPMPLGVGLAPDSPTLLTVLARTGKTNGHFLYCGGGLVA
jgi:hypothetical protein